MQVIIKPSKGLIRSNLKELWAYRELLYFLAWRDVKVRYKQTALGAAWAVIQPLLLMVVFSIFLGKLAGIKSSDVPYPVFAFTALVPWTLFSQILTGPSNSLVSSANLLSKIYFPRLLLPFSSAGSYLLDFAIAVVVLVGMLLYYRIVPGMAALLLPLFTLLAFLAAMAVGTFLSALNVRYRDVRYALPFLVQLWLFASPVAYSSDLVRDRFGPFWQTVYGLNPMAGVAEGFRWALLGEESPPPGMLLASGLITIVILIGAITYFRKTERTFADVI